MPAVTLQRAAQIFNRIKAETTFATEPDDDEYGYRRRGRATKAKATFTLSVTLSVDGPVVQQAEAYRTLVLAKKNQMFGLMTIGSEIRHQMALKQTSVGVSKLVTNRVMVVQKIKILEHLIEAIETQTLNAELLGSQAEAIKQRLAVSTTATTSAMVGSTVLTAEDREALNREVREQRSTLMAIDDELSRLNAANTITIPDGDFKTLQEAGLA